MNFSLIPLSWKIGAGVLLAAALMLGHTWSVKQADKRGYVRAVTERAAADSKAIINRTVENAAIAVKQAQTNTVITKAKNEEVAPVIKRIYVDRVRVGQGTCGSAASTKADDAASSDSADSSGRLVSQRTEDDIRALTVAVEEDLATGRACQTWGVANGFVP